MFTSTYSKDPKVNLPFEEFKQILFLAKKFTESKNSTFHFVYLPQFERYKSKASNNQYNYHFLYNLPMFESNNLYKV